VRVAQAVGQVLAELGVERCFGVVGSGNFEVTNALVAGGVRFLPTRHESGAVTAADAYARVSGHVGLVTVHQGPGLTNSVTGLAEAAKSRTPMLVLAGDSPAGARHSNFQMDQAGLAESVGALSETLGGAEGAVADVLRAWGRALSERKPVVVTMPIDVQAAECAVPDSFKAPPLPAPAPPDAESLSVAARLLTAARRPLLLAGRGAVLAGAGPPIQRLARATGALLATSAVANGLFAGDPYYLGIAGGFATPLAAELMASADAVVAFGASLNMWTTRHGRLLSPTARVIQVDLEADAIGAHHGAALGVVGDAAETARALLDLVGGGSAQTWRTPAGATGPTRTLRRMAASIPGLWWSPSTTCCRLSGCWPATAATSWAGCPCTARSPTSRGWSSRKPSRPSAAVSPPPWGRRWRGPTAWSSAAWATVAR